MSLQPFKTILNSLRKHPRMFVFGWIVLMVAVFGWRLALGPIRIDGLRPIIVSRLEAQIPHTRASLKHLDLVWFADARAVGFRFEDVMIRDRDNRIIARAGRMETALAADSLLLTHFAPARLTARDFYLVASVSKDGRYELGFDARGRPDQGPSGLDRLFLDLIGKEQLGRPVSFARQVSLRNGELRLIQQGAALDWTAKVAAIDFSKLRGQLKARADLAIVGRNSQARFQAQADGVIGLKQASISANIHDLVPAHVFPSVGLTRHLAALNAPVDGLARINYSLAKGFDGAWLDIDAGAGHIDVGGSRQVFDSARIRATYNSLSHTARFETFRLRSHLLDTDLSGEVVITPADTKTKRDLRVAFDFVGPRLTGRLADDFSHQTLTNARIRGAYMPTQRRLDIAQATGSLNGAPFESEGTVYTNEKGQLGADLSARINGHFTKDEVFAFWPEDLSSETRSELIRRLQGGDYANADFTLKAPPGHFEEGQLEDADLRLDFDFRDLGLVIDDRMQPARGLSGRGTLLGNSFTMDVDGGRLVDVELTRGALSVPDFNDHSTKTTIWLETEGEAVAVIEAVDPLAGGTLTRNGLNRERMTGQAKVRVDIAFPTFGAITDDNFDLKFTGQIRQASLARAALGWDLMEGDLSVRGDKLADQIEVAGTAQVGPYRGDITYRTHFEQAEQDIDFKGSFNAERFGGSPRVPVAISGRFAMADGKGQGQVDADIFRGTVNWEGDATVDGGRPSRLLIEGVTLGQGMAAQGLPVFDRLKQALPTRISLLRSGEIWAGEVDAESLSGDMAYIEGQRPRLVYKSIMTPDEAREMGYGGLPVFRVPRNLTVNVALDDESRSALLRLDEMNAALGWSEEPDTGVLQRRLKMTVRPQDWATLGLPADIFTPIAPVEVTALWQQMPDSLRGQVNLLGHVIDFNMPSHDSERATGQDPYTLRVRGQIGDDLLRVLGYSHDPVEISGRLDVAFSLYDAPGQSAAVVHADAEQAGLRIRGTDWVKPAGEAARFVVAMDETSDADGQPAGVNLSRIVADGDRIRINGRAALNEEGDLEFADFSSLYLKGFTDVAYRYYSVEDSDVVSVTGRQLDLRPWLKRKDTLPVATTSDVGKPARRNRPVHLVVDLDQVKVAADTAFDKVALDLNWDGDSGMGGQGSAITADGHPVALSVEAQAGYSLFSVTTDDLGSVVSTASGTRQIKGGKAVIEGAYMAGQIDATLKGEDIRVKQIPVLAQLLTVASLQGAADTLTGEGIAFSDFEFPVRYRDGRLFVNDGWAKGGAMGISVWGTTDTKAKTMAFDGTLIPAYRINAMFGDLGSNGLGLLGLKYGVGGTFATPSVMVDPLSVMMPGFLKVWERDQIKVDPMAALKLPSVKDRLAQMREETQAEQVAIRDGLEAKN